MRKIIYRDGLFIDRDDEEKFILERLEKRSENILFIYGPKSSGKTNFIEYIVEEKLSKKRDRFYVNYINFRRYAIVNYSSFLNVYFFPIREENKPFLAKMSDKFKLVFDSLRGEVSLPEEGVNFAISLNLFEAMERNDLDQFKVIFEVLKKIKSTGRVPVLIIDEVQELKDIYMNGDIKKRYLLTEFFKFLVSLTKETHLAHIIVLTSSSLFIDEIYNNSNLAQTSEFFLFDHFNYEVIREWLEDEGFSLEEIDLVWEYLGGCPFNILNLLSNRDILPNFELKSYLHREAMLMRGKIDFTMVDLDKEERQDYFIELMKTIIENGFALRNSKNKLQTEVLNVVIDKDILFVRAETGEIIFNSQIMKKGAELYLNQIKR
ncbi:MAG: ATP-binding protein [Desulfonauticus sp.]|nr:ATP-binding protein [Desulfonauticus sp.]